MVNSSHIQETWQPLDTGHSRTLIQSPIASLAHPIVVLLCPLASILTAPLQGHNTLQILLSLTQGVLPLPLGTCVPRTQQGPNSNVTARDECLALAWLLSNTALFHRIYGKVNSPRGSSACSGLTGRSVCESYPFGSPLSLAPDSYLALNESQRPTAPEPMTMVWDMRRPRVFHSNCPSQV